MTAPTPPTVDEIAEQAAAMNAGPAKPRAAAQQRYEANYGVTEAVSRLLQVCGAFAGSDRPGQPDADEIRRRLAFARKVISVGERRLAALEGTVGESRHGHTPTTAARFRRWAESLR